MGFISSIKNKLGIGGVKISLDVPGQVSKDSNQIEGSFTLTTKSEQEIISYEVKLVEEYTTGRGDNKKTQEFDLGLVEIFDNFMIMPSEVKKIEFTLPFKMLKSNADSLQEEGGALKTLGKMSKFANNEKSSFYVDVSVDVKSAVLDPSEMKDIKLV